MDDLLRLRAGADVAAARERMRAEGPTTTVWDESVVCWDSSGLVCHNQCIAVIWHAWVRRPVGLAPVAVQCADAVE
jgi:hypothetical protein